MIVEERSDAETVYHYSDAGKKIIQVETGIVYDEAYDIYPCPYTYIESEEDIVSDEELPEDIIEDAESLKIILGEEV